MDRIDKISDRFAPEAALVGAGGEPPGTRLAVIFAAAALCWTVPLLLLYLLG